MTKSLGSSCAKVKITPTLSSSMTTKKSMQVRLIIRSCILFTFLILFSTFTLPFSKQNNKYHLTNEEYEWLEKFFRYFLFHENAIYTLAGTKPLTCMTLLYDAIPESQNREDHPEAFNYFLLNRNNPRDRTFYENLSEQDKGFLIREQDFIYPITTFWEKWEKFSERFQLKKSFLLIKKERPFDQWKDFFPNYKEMCDVYFVNVLQTALVIQENYALFKQTVGYDFDPLEVVFELENQHSQFWDRIHGEEGWKYSSLWGLLYGFGKENAFSYLWRGRHLKESHRSDKEKQWALSLKRRGSAETRPACTDKGAFTLSHFSIPIFMSFSEHDPLITKYENEKKQIEQLYEGKDFVTFTLDLLIDRITSDRS